MVLDSGKILSQDVNLPRVRLAYQVHLECDGEDMGSVAVSRYLALLDFFYVPA